MGRQVEHLAAASLDQLPHSRPLVGAEVVHHHYLCPARRVGASTPAPRTPRTPRAVGGAVHRKRGSHPAEAHAREREQRRALAAVARHRAVGSPADRRVGVERRKSEVLAPISSTSTIGFGSSRAATVTRQAALSHSPLSLAPTDLFLGSTPGASTLATRSGSSNASP